jgi:hypothetical protein
MSIADKARRVPGVAAAEGAVTGAFATEDDLPINDYDKQNRGRDRGQAERHEPARAAPHRRL